MAKFKLPITEELDFHYLLCLLPPLRGIPEYAWLPELLSTIKFEDLIKLCQYAGGETIRIPTIDELTDSINSLQAFYDCDIKKITDSVPSDLQAQVEIIRQVYSDAK